MDNRYATAAEVAASEEKILDALEGLMQQGRENRDEWKCDEYEEELLILLQARRDGDDSVETEREIEKIRQSIEKLRCERFEDFG